MVLEGPDYTVNHRMELFLWYIKESFIFYIKLLHSIALFTNDFKKRKNFSLISGKLLKSYVIIYRVGSNTPFNIIGIIQPNYPDILSKIFVYITMVSHSLIYGMVVSQSFNIAYSGPINFSIIYYELQLGLTLGTQFEKNVINNLKMSFLTPLIFLTEK